MLTKNQNQNKITYVSEYTLGKECSHTPGITPEIIDYGEKKIILQWRDPADTALTGVWNFILLIVGKLTLDPSWWTTLESI